MKRYSLLLLLFTIVSIVTVLSGCCCCCGGDGFTSKYTKSVDEITFPSKLVVGGTTYNLVSSTTFGTQQDCVDKFLSNSREEGFDTEGAGDLVSVGAQITGISEAKEFVYQSTGGDKLKGFVGRSGSPGQLSGACSLAQQIVSSIADINSGSSPGLGDESWSYTTVLPNDKRGYATAARDSNMFVFAYTYSSYATSNEAVEAALEAIDDAL